MQNPKTRLTVGAWYKVVSKAVLRAGKSVHSRVVMKLEADSMVMFLGYHTGSVRVCKILYQDMVGWLIVDSKYGDHFNYFKRVETDKCS